MIRYIVNKYNIQKLNLKMENEDNSPKRAQQKMLQVHVELRVHMGVAVRPLTGGRGSKLTDELYIS